MNSPLCIDLFCGLGGWAEGFLSEGYEVIGFDIERHDYGTGGYPAQLVLQDVLTLHGSQFRNAAVIVASPPCQRYSYMAMPWDLSKREVRWQEWERNSPFGDRLEGLNRLFDACFRIQREAIEATRHNCHCGCGYRGQERYIPLVVENVKGAQPWVGRAKWHYGSYYLWGDVPALMPSTQQLKQPGRNFHFPEKYGIPSPSFHGAAHEPSVQAALATKNNGGSWFAQAHNTESGHSRNPVNDAVKTGGDWFGSGENCSPMRMREEDYQRWCGGDGTKQAGINATRDNGKGAGWFQNGAASKGSASHARKAASAQIAKIPFPLAEHIAKVYHP